MGMNRISISIFHQPKVECTAAKVHVFRVCHNSVSTENSHSKANKVSVQEQAEHREGNRNLFQEIRSQRVGSAHQGRHAEGQRVHPARGERMRDELFCFFLLI